MVKRNENSRQQNQRQIPSFSVADVPDETNSASTTQRFERRRQRADHGFNQVPRQKRQRLISSRSSANQSIAPQTESVTQQYNMSQMSRDQGSSKTQTMMHPQQYGVSQSSSTSHSTSFINGNNWNTNNNLHTNNSDTNRSIFDESILINANVSIINVLKQLLVNNTVFRQHAIESGALSNELKAIEFCSKLIKKYGANVYWDIRNLIETMDLAYQRNFDILNSCNKNKK